MKKIILTTLVLCATLTSYAQQNSKYENYKVSVGDTFASVAKKFGVTPEQIKKANPKYEKYLIAGTTILIPKAAQSSSKDSSAKGTSSKSTGSKSASKDSSTKSSSSKSSSKGSTSKSSSGKGSNSKSSTSSKSSSKSNSGKDDEMRRLEKQKLKAETEKAQAEAELARLRLEKERNSRGNSSKGSSSRSSSYDSHHGEMDYRGFKTLAQVTPTFKSGMFGVSTTLDFGSVVADGLFIGAGPSLGILNVGDDVYYPASILSTVHYAIPTRGQVRPYVDGHWGVGTPELNVFEDFYFMQNYTAGVQFGNGTFLGAYFDINQGEFTPGVKVGFGMPRTDGRTLPIVPVRDTGLELSIDGSYIGQEISVDDRGDVYVILRTSYALGYRLSSQLSVGAGFTLGHYDWTFANSIDLYGGFFARAQYRFFDKPFTPFAELELGYDYSKPEKSYDQRLTIGASYLTPRIGFALRRTNNSYFTMKLEYQQYLGYSSDEEGFKDVDYSAYGYGISFGWTHVFSLFSK